MFKKMLSFFLLLSVVFSFSLTPVAIAQGNSEKNNNSDLRKPIHATNIKIAKKIFDPSAIKGIKTKDRPDKPENNKKPSYNGVATGVLGTGVTGNKYAIIIGICDYPGSNYDLCWADGDSLNMRNALVNKYGYSDENIYMFRDTDPNRTDITDGAATFNNIKDAILNKIKPNISEGDEVVFFFSGHGGSLYTDIDPEDEIDGTDEIILVHNGSEVVGISDDTLVSWFHNFGTSRIVFVFDTCHAGGMNDLTSEGRIVVMATEENRSAYVYSTGVPEIEEGEGVFSRLFVNLGMLQDFADGYNNLKKSDENVAVEEAFDYAKKNIPGRIKRIQRPVISDGFLDDLLL
ncbi:MAG: caspase family protein [Patescibacteria group bacterium]|nr:caspase family protein [Patescibacteria group bacterium]